MDVATTCPVRRKDLYRISSTSPSPDLDPVSLSISDQSVVKSKARLQEQLAETHFMSIEDPRSRNLGALEDQSSVYFSHGDIEEHGTEEEEKEQTYAFRLFSQPYLSKARRINIKSPSPPPFRRKGEDSGFIVPRRPTSYYFAATLNQVEKEAFEAVAVSGEDVVGRFGRERWVSAGLRS